MNPTPPRAPTIPIRIKGELEIIPAIGMIYFHDESGITRLRICQLKPTLTKLVQRRENFQLIDITHMIGGAVE
jgi:hypothetical protein